MNKQKIIIADTAFLPNSVLNDWNFINIFPMEKNDTSFRDSLDNLLERSRNQSEFFDGAMERILPVFEAKFPELGIQNKYFLRATLVTITSIYLDRTIRVIKKLERLNDLEKKTCKYLNVEKQYGYSWLGKIQGQTWRLNQEVINEIMHALGYKGVTILEPSQYPEFPNERTQKNYLFSPPQIGWLGRYHKILNKIYSKFENLTCFFASYQNMGFGSDRYYMVKRGLIGPFGFFHKPLNNNLISGEFDQKQRDKLYLQTECFLVEEFGKLLKKQLPMLSESLIKSLSSSYAILFYRWYPTSYLESLVINYQKIESQLSSRKIKAIIGHDTTSDLGYFAGAFAKNKGVKVIGVQHGGHYGYIEDMSIVAQFEYYFYDQMVTWGWQSIDDHLPKCKIVALPSPKLSEAPLRSKYLIDFDLKNDVLFFSNLFHRFPHISTCGQARVDFLDEITDSQEEMVAMLVNNKISIKHKPYSFNFVDLYPQHYQRLQDAGSEYYELLNTSHKGLTVDLIQTCKIVLWDQLGTGTIECFTSEVPTIVYWPRVYSRPSFQALEHVKRLEDVGVIHQNSKSLAIEINKFKQDPQLWMNDKNRVDAIKFFCQTFGLVDKNWKKSWQKCLNNGFSPR